MCLQGQPDALCNLVHTLLTVADWSNYDEHMSAIEACVDRQLSLGQLPAMQPFHAFMYPIHLSKVKRLAQAYARRAEEVAAAAARVRQAHALTSRARQEACAIARDEGFARAKKEAWAPPSASPARRRRC